MPAGAMASAWRADAIRCAIARAKEVGACVLRYATPRMSAASAPMVNLLHSAGCVFTAFVLADDHDIAAPFACAEPRLGTAPFCIAVPGADGYWLMLDMATTTIAAGKARVAFNKGVPVPEGYADRFRPGSRPPLRRASFATKPARWSPSGGTRAPAWRCCARSWRRCRPRQRAISQCRAALCTRRWRW